jgi:abhydrolase domain-containing protein 12
VLAYPLVVYLALGAALIAPDAQTILICMHWSKYVLRADFDRPADQFVLGARNVALRSSDELRLGAWHVLPARSLARLGDARAESAGDTEANAAFFDAELRSGEAPVVLFLHGNGEHRAVQQGPIHQQLISAGLNAHALALDYRGFGDSEGWPTEEGLATDARAAWVWLTEQHGVPPSRVLIWGHSLGSGVAARLAAELYGSSDLGEVAQQPMGLVLESAFTSLPELLPDYPLGRAICWLPGVHGAISSNLNFVLNNTQQLQALLAATPSARILLMHGEQDMTVPATHSRALFATARAAGGQQVSLLELPLAEHNNVLANDEVAITLAKLLAESESGGLADTPARPQRSRHEPPGAAARRP